MIYEEDDRISKYEPANAVVPSVLHLTADWSGGDHVLVAAVVAEL